MPEDLRSLFAKQDAALGGQSTEAPLSPAEQAEYDTLLTQERESKLAAQGDFKKEGLGEIDTSMGRGADFTSRLARGFTGTLAAVPKGLAEIYEGTVGDDDIEGNLLYELGEGLENIGERADINPEYSDEFIAQLGQGLGSAAGFLLPGGVAGAAFRVGTTAAKVAQYAVPGGIGALAGASEQVEDYRRTTGGEPDEDGQRLRLAALGALGGSTEALPIGRVLGRFGNIGDDLLKAAASETGKVGLKETAKIAGKAGIKGLFEEGSQELFQEGLKNYVAKEIEGYDEDRNIEEGLFEAGRTGGAVGFIMNATLGTMGVRVRAKALGLSDKAEEFKPETQTGEAPLRDAGEVTPTTEGAVSIGAGGDFINPDTPRMRYDFSGKTKPTNIQLEGVAFTAKDISQSSFQTMDNLSKYEVSAATGTSTFTASQRRDAEVLAALPEEEQQKAMDGDSASPAANRAASLATETTKIQKAVNEAVDEVGQTALKPKAKKKAVVRRASKKLLDLGMQIDEGIVKVPQGQGFSKSKTKPVKTKTETGESVETPGDERTPQEKSIDTNLDFLEQAYNNLSGRDVSENKQTLLEKQYNQALQAYAAAITRGTEGINLEQGIERAIAEAKQYGIYHTAERVDAATMADDQIKTEENIDTILESKFPAITTGKFKGGRKAGTIKFNVSELENYKAALAEKGLYGKTVTQTGNEVTAYLVSTGRKHAGKDPLELLASTSDKKRVIPEGVTHVDLNKMVDLDDAIRDKGEVFFGGQEEYTLTEKPTGTEEGAGAEVTVTPREQTPGGETISLLMKNTKKTLQKMMREADLKYVQGDSKYVLSRALLNNADTAIDKAKQKGAERQRSLKEDAPLVTTPAYEAEQAAVEEPPPTELRPEDEEFFGGNFPSEEVTPPSKSDTGKLTDEQKKQVEDEAEALRKEIAAIEDDGTPFDDDDLFSSLSDTIRGKRKRMSNVDKAKSKKFFSKMKKLAKQNGLDIYDTWTGNEQLPGWAESSILDLINDKNLVRLKGTRGWINLPTREVVIFGNNIDSYERFQKTVFHEVIGHFSMESMFGQEKLDNFIKGLLKDPRWQQAAADKKASYISAGIPMDDLKAMREVIARISETKELPGLLRRVVTWVKHQLRRLGFDSTLFSEDDILSYVAKATSQFEKGTLPQIDLRNPQVMNSFVTDVFKGAIQRGTDVSHSKTRMRGVIERLLPVTTNLDQYQGAWTRAANSLYESVAKTAIPRYYSALKDLPYKQVYNYIRQIGLGDSSKFDQRANRLWHVLDTVSDTERQELYTYFTTREAKLAPEWGTEQQRAAAEEAKDTIIEQGKELVDFGFLDESVEEANRGQYLHTAYLAFMMNEDKASSIYGGGAKLSLQNYLKRKTLDDDTAKQALGWIKDPVFMATQSIAMVGRDIALLRMADGMSYSSNRMSGNLWMTPDIPGVATVWSGTYDKSGTPKKINPFLALAELAGLRKNVLNKSHPSEKPGLIKLYDEQEQMIRNHIAEFGNANDYAGLENIDVSKYKYVEHGKRNGAFSGRFIKKEIYNDVRASYAAFAAEDPGIVEKLIGQYGALTTINRFWKNTKTVWNPPTHVRNFIGNFVNLDISTSTNSLKLSKMVEEELVTYLDAIANNKSIDEMPYYWQVADKLGITETTFTAQEARAILDKWKTQHHGGKVQDWVDKAPDHAPTRWIKKNMPQMRDRFHALANLMGNTYQGSETLFKVVKLRDTMQRYEKAMGRKIESIENEGERLALESMAVQDAQKWIFDYSAVPRSIRYLRNAPIGAPFISFAYLALPRMFEASAKHPVKIMKYMTLPYAVGQISALAGAFDDGDDWDTVKNQLPNYQREKYSVMPMPWKDENGDPVIWDMGYYIPFSPYVEAARSYTRKFITKEDPDMGMIEPVLDMGILSGPIPDVLTALKSGQDPFTNRPIIREYGTVTEKLYDGLVYGWSTAAPTFLTDKGWAGKTLDVLADSPENYNPRTGKRKESLGRATARLAGFTTSAVDLEDSRATNIRYMKSQISRAKAASTKEVKQARAAGQSTQQLADIRKKHSDKIKLYRSNLLNYREKSR